jgi:hypothetical protein
VPIDDVATGFPDAMKAIRGTNLEIQLRVQNAI